MIKKLIFSILLLPFGVSAQIISTVAGNGLPGYTGDGGAATAAAIQDPGGVAFDATGNIYFSGYTSNTLRKISSSGIITTVAGNGSPGYSGDGGPATAALLNGPTKICGDMAGNIYIADQLNNRIRKITPSGLITTVAGNGTPGYSGDGRQATAAKLTRPSGVICDATGNLYIADYFNNAIRKVATSGIITTIAGNGIPGDTGDGGMATDANLQHPFGVTLDTSGNLYICDQLNAKIRKVTPAGVITTLAGNGVSTFSGDGGPATGASFNWPSSVAIDTSGNILVDDFYNNRVRKITPAGIISTVIGNGTGAFFGDGGPATAAEINLSNEIVFNSSHDLFICDNDNYRIRKVVRVATTGTETLSPESVSIYPNPVHGSFMLHIPLRYSATSIQIINCIGHVIKKLDVANNSTDFNISDIPPGIYILKISCNDQNVYKNIIKD